jgi:hypothetical protein
VIVSSPDEQNATLAVNYRPVTNCQWVSTGIQNKNIAALIELLLEKASTEHSFIKS